MNRFVFVCPTSGVAVLTDKIATPAAPPGIIAALLCKKTHVAADPADDDPEAVMLDFVHPTLASRSAGHPCRKARPVGVKHGFGGIGHALAFGESGTLASSWSLVGVVPWNRYFSAGTTSPSFVLFSRSKSSSIRGDRGSSGGPYLRRNTSLKTEGIGLRPATCPNVSIYSNLL
jgi:hypothetical protein